MLELLVVKAQKILAAGKELFGVRDYAGRTSRARRPPMGESSRVIVPP